ncbi:hypothetical protein B9J78_06755 [bacterium Unc6]|nr:hypothetical protein [bacterium Unc6]
MNTNEESMLKLYVSPEGNDAWSGRLPEPNAKKNDGPLATLNGIQSMLHLMKAGRNYDSNRWQTDECLSKPVEVYLRGGVYAMKTPLILSAEDSWPVTFKPYRNEKPVISGGERITGWKTTTINRKTALWVVDLPEVAEGKWCFRQLFVNGRRAERPRLPKKGLFRMKEALGMKLPAGWGGGGQTQFICNPGEVRPFRNLTDVEVVYLHFWIEERSGIAAFDPDSNLVTMQRPSWSALVGSYSGQLADYYLDNVFEELSEPGEWYLSRKEGRLYYLPRGGETPGKTEIIAPRCLQLLALVGKPEENQYVEHIRFEGIRFAHTDWRHPDPSDRATFIGPDASRTPHSRQHNRGVKASAAQAACDVPGVIYFEGARFCAIEQCAIEHIGWYGVEIADACHGIRVVGNTIHDMGAGGVKINGAAACDPDVKIRQTGHHQVTDNEIARGGRIFHSAVGVLSMNAHTVAICHNHIHDLFYSGISCGWEWGYQENVSRDNLIAFNHIHDIGHKLLSDMGGIYTLGVQSGTVLRNNLIYNVSSAHYGGWCIYPDEGSSHLLIENNVCYDADRQPFHQHYGRENMVRNNIWAFGGEAVAIYTRIEPHRGFTWIRNIMVSSGEPFFLSNHTVEKEAGRIHSDLNLFYAVKRRPYFKVGGKNLTLKQWQAMGRDLHSIVVNPKFRNLNKRDFTLAADSPALKLGFVPIDLSEVGPRPVTGKN